MNLRFDPGDLDDIDGPVPGCACEDCADERDLQAWEDEMAPAADAEERGSRDQHA